MKILFLTFIAWQAHLLIAQDFAAQRNLMVLKQISQRGISNKRVLDAMKKVERHRFVPPAIIIRAYEDEAQPIGEGQTISQPYVVAFMTDAIHIQPEDKVLEIGTGSGYQSAVLAELCKEVYTIEINPVLAARAEAVLKSLHYETFISEQETDIWAGQKLHPLMLSPLHALHRKYRNLSLTSSKKVVA